MKNKFLGLTGVFILIAVLLTGPVQAAELLDVKPVATGSGVVIEVTADIPMTYTYYKVPGQARAVVDIADADPEKVEPLIVVNKGVVSSISVDKAMIGDMTVSRLVFNLVAESEISVSHAPDRKTLNVSFGGDKTVAAQPTTAPPAPVAAVPVPIEPAVPAAAAVVAPETKESAAVAASSQPLSKEEEDPLGLNETQPVVVPAKEPVAVAASSKTVSKEEEDPLGLDEVQPAAVPVKELAPAAVSSAKLSPVVPATVDQAAPVTAVVKGIVIGASFIDIQTTGPVEKFTSKRLSKPERLSIEIPGTSTVSVNSILVKRFGVSKVRIGKTPGLVRVVLDTTKPAFPKYEIVSVEKGLRINFK